MRGCRPPEGRSELTPDGKAAALGPLHHFGLGHARVDGKLAGGSAVEQGREGVDHHQAGAFWREVQGRMEGDGEEMGEGWGRDVVDSSQCGLDGVLCRCRSLVALMVERGPQYVAQAVPNERCSSIFISVSNCW